MQLRDAAVVQRQRQHRDAVAEARERGQLIVKGRCEGMPTPRLAGPRASTKALAAAGDKCR
jgi:hypothetical protein